MRTRMIMALAAVFLCLPFANAFAMDHEGMDHGKMEKMEHTGMNTAGEMYMLGDVVVDGVKAMAHVKDVHEAMSKMGMDVTHHFMVMFVDTKTGDPINSGTVALKIESPSGQETGPFKLMGMQGHFGVDITLKEKGKYEFKVGSKLADNQTRQFEFEYQNH